MKNTLRVFYIPKEQKGATSRKRRKSIGRLTATALAFAVTASAVFIYAPWFHITLINVSGLNPEEAEIMRNAVRVELDGWRAFVVPKKHIVLLPAAGLTEVLEKKFPFIASAAISREFPHTIQVSVKKRSLFGILCPLSLVGGALSDMPERMAEHSGVPNPTCGYIDTNGFVYDRSPFSSGYLITKIVMDTDEIAVGMQAIQNDIMDRMKVLSELLPGVIGSPIIGFRLGVNIPREIRVESREGFFLILNADDEVSQVSRVLKIVLDKEIGKRRNNLEYIDLRFGNKVFYKFKDKNPAIQTLP